MEQYFSYIEMVRFFFAIGREIRDITQCCVEPWTDGVHTVIVPIEVHIYKQL